MPILDKTNKIQIAKYTEFLAKKENSTIEQDFGFLSADKNREFEIVYLEQNDNIIASVALVVLRIDEKHTALLGLRGPMCDIYDISCVTKLMQEAQPLVKKYNAILCTFCPEVIITDKLEHLYKKKGFCIVSKLFCIPHIDNKSVVVSLNNKSEQEVLDSLSSKTKYNVENAPKRNIKIKAGATKKDFDKFLELYKEHNDVKFQDIKNFETFKNLLKQFDTDTIRVYTATVNGKLLAGGIICKYGNKVKCLEETYVEENIGILARARLHFEAIKWAISSNCVAYDFGGVEKETDLRFKEGFASKDGIVHYIGNICIIYDKLKYFRYKIFGGKYGI